MQPFQERTVRASASVLDRYDAVLAQAVESQGNSTPTSRRAFYEQTRKNLVFEMRSAGRASSIDSELRVFDEAVKRLETRIRQSVPKPSPATASLRASTELPPRSSGPKSNGWLDDLLARASVDDSGKTTTATRAMPPREDPPPPRPSFSNDAREINRSRSAKPVLPDREDLLARLSLEVGIPPPPPRQPPASRIPPNRALHRSAPAENSSEVPKKWRGELQLVSALPSTPDILPAQPRTAAPQARTAAPSQPRTAAPQPRSAPPPPPPRAAPSKPGTALATAADIRARRWDTPSPERVRHTREADISRMLEDVIAKELEVAITEGRHEALRLAPVLAPLPVPMIAPPPPQIMEDDIVATPEALEAWTRRRRLLLMFFGFSGFLGVTCAVAVMFMMIGMRPSADHIPGTAIEALESDAGTETAPPTLNTQYTPPAAPTLSSPPPPPTILASQPSAPAQANDAHANGETDRALQQFMRWRKNNDLGAAH
ncbi:MAG: hypothetical protein FWD68_00150 [Alphaproteobacteria bacterium]|nr:hypothetical protein [Alphaproteobacteria bacterium]